VTPLFGYRVRFPKGGGGGKSSGGEETFTEQRASSLEAVFLSLHGDSIWEFFYDTSSNKIYTLLWTSHTLNLVKGVFESIGFAGDVSPLEKKVLYDEAHVFRGVVSRGARAGEAVLDRVLRLFLQYREPAVVQVMIRNKVRSYKRDKTSEVVERVVGIGFRFGVTSARLEAEVRRLLKGELLFHSDTLQAMNNRVVVVGDMLQPNDVAHVLRARLYSLPMDFGTRYIPPAIGKLDAVWSSAVLAVLYSNFPDEVKGALGQVVSSFAQPGRNGGADGRKDSGKVQTQAS